MDMTAIVQSFITSRTADGCSPRTLQDYRRVLEPFAAWCAAGHLDLIVLDREAVRRHVAALRERGWSESTVAIHVRNLRAFLRWCYEEGHTEDNLAQAVKAPKKVVRVEEPLSEWEILLLLDACQGDRWAARDRAIILTFLDTGLRIGEIAGLRREDLHLNDGGTAWIQVYAAKTKSYRFVFLGEATTAAVVEYLAGREDTLGALWVGKRPGRPVKPLEKEAIYRMVKRRARQAGLPDDRVHPHLFRKTFATGWLDNGGDAERLRVLAGWSSYEMLGVYVESSRRRLEEAHRRAGLVDRLLK